jgi:transglutaminase-like putative cysteine protease
MKKISLLIILNLVMLCTYAQNFTFGEVTGSDFNFDKRTIDSNANALILKEFGTTRLQLDEATGRIVVIFQYHVKIKIYNKEGFKHANIIIPTYKDGDTEESIQDLQASTFNIISGRSVETEMDNKAVFKENRSKYTLLTKFTLPNIKEGSVIEYSYQLTSPLIFNFKTWEFQDEIPKVSSEYVAYIPANYNYNVILRGFYKLSDQKSEISRECIRLSGTPIDCSKMTYLMKNVPAFIEEGFMTASSNFKSAIYFELSDVQMMNGSKQAYTKSWRDVDYELITNKDIGGQMKKKDVFKALIPSILQNTTDELSRAKAVYNYIKKQLKWNNYYGIRTEDNLKTILDARTGNVADINLCLIAALKRSRA